jgi:hypothetical protein
MRRFTFSVCLFILIWTACPMLVAQTVPTPSSPQATPVRDPVAVSTIQSAIAAMGGVTAVGTIQSSIAQGTSVDTPDDGNGSTNFVWSHSGQEFRYENVAAVGSHVFVSNSGSPCDIEGNTVVPSASHVARASLPFHIPALVLFNELSSSNYTLIYVGVAPLNGISAVHIQTIDHSDPVGQLVTPQDWYFDSTTSLPVSVQYRIPSAADPQIWFAGSISFGNYQAVNGALLPFRLTIQEGEGAAPTVVATISSITFNTPISSTQCGAPLVVESAQ